MSDLTDKKKKCKTYFNGSIPPQTKAKANLQTAERGRIIMKALLAEGFNKEQVVGICSCLFQESSWDSTSINSSGVQKCGSTPRNGSGAGGLCQWLPGCNGNHRQHQAVTKINEWHKTNYKINKYDWGKHTWENNFREVPLEYQIEYFLFEIRSVAPYSKVYNTLKNCRDAYSACTVMVVDFEKPGKDSIEKKEHQRHLDFSREVFERYFDDDGNPKKT